MISVYNSTEKLFDNNGIKILKPEKALIRKEDNGEYSLSIKDNIEYLDFYREGMIIRTDTPWGKQGFRITNVEVDNNYIILKANHLYFDSKRYVITDSYVVDKNLNDALDYLNNTCETKTPFTTISDIETINSFRCVRKTLEEAIVTLIERWGGHLVRDNFNIGIRKVIGEDRGVTLEAGKNITKLNSKENWDEVITKILPVGKDGILLEEKYIKTIDNLYELPYTKVISFSQDEIEESSYEDKEKFKEALRVDLKNKAKKYLEDNKFPKVNYVVEAYLKNISDVGDLIRVKHPKCNVELLTNVIALEYDCILEKYKKIEFGNFKSKLKDLVSHVQKQVEEVVKKDTDVKINNLSQELEKSTTSINDSFGKSHVIYENRDELLIVDSLPKENAKYAIKINSKGIGFSENGINGVFNSAWTIDGTLNMQHINVINLVADMIKGGTLKLGSNFNQSGILEIYNEENNLISRFDKTGIEIYRENEDIIKLNPQVGLRGYSGVSGVLEAVFGIDRDVTFSKKLKALEEFTLEPAKFVPMRDGEVEGVGVVSTKGGIDL
nr:MAG TPA: tail protein [Caudoviricetes sp.]